MDLQSNWQAEKSFTQTDPLWYTYGCEKEITTDVTLSWQAGKSFPQTNMYMLENEIATDVTFSFPDSGQRIKAHKVILMSRSSVFFAMFTCGLQDVHKDVIIDDINAAAFKKFLRYLYGEELEDLKTDVTCLLYTAEKYALQSLKDRCIDYLAGNIKVRTVAETLEQALLYNASTLVEKCLVFFSTLFYGDLTCLTHYHISRESLDTIVSYQGMYIIGTLKVFEACNTWAYDECELKDLHPSSDNKREVLGDILQKIPFGSMTSEEFATHVSPVGLLTLEDEVEIFRFLSKQGKTLIDMTMTPIPATLRIPGTVLNNQALPGFWMEIKCDRRFRIIGFSFIKTGCFKMAVNNKEQTFDVSQPGMKTYLQMPKRLCYKHTIAYGVEFPSSNQRILAVPFSMSCRGGQVKFKGRSYSCTNAPVPFEAFLVDFQQDTYCSLSLL